MKWSQLKKRIEDGMADSVRGRVQIWTTRYRHAHDDEGEAWITIDGERTQSFGSLTYYIEHHHESQRMLEERGSPDWQEPSQRAEYHNAHRDADRSLAKKGVLPLWEVNRLLFCYLNTGIETILNSDNPLIRAIGLLDKRCGKRRLAAIDPATEHPLVQTVYRVRCKAEGITEPEPWGRGDGKPAPQP
jgi:hypothetical protein